MKFKTQYFPIKSISYLFNLNNLQITLLTYENYNY